MARFERVGVRATVEGVQRYVSDAERVNRSTRGMTGATKDVGGAFRLSARDALKFGAAVAGVDIGVRAASAALKVLVGDTLGASISFESSFAGIRKTMDLTEAEFERLALANRELAKDIPVTVDEINRIGELAGQLGVRGVQNVVKFEDTIAKLAVTTDLTSESAALAFAQIANVLQIPQSQVDQMGAAVVDLGNNFATVESKIVNFTQRIAGAGKISGLTVGDLTGIATAFSSVGSEAEAGGTAVQKVLIAMQGAVASGGDELELFAAVAGRTVDEFSELFRTDAAEAFVSFVEGLGAAGEDGIRVLQELGLEDQRLVRNFLAAAGAGEILRRAIERGNEAFEENTALNEEAARRFETTESKLRLLRNRFHDLQIAAGDAALLGLEPLLDATLDWIDTNGDQFAEDLARAIEGGIQFARDLAEEIGRLASFLRDIAQIGVIRLPIKVAMSQADKLTLVTAAVVGGFLVGGPGGAAFLGGAATGLLLSEFLASTFGLGGGGGGPGAPTVYDAIQSGIDERIAASFGRRFGVGPATVRRAVELGFLRQHDFEFFPTGDILAEFQEAQGGPLAAAQNLDSLFAQIFRRTLDDLGRQSFDVPLPPGGVGGGVTDARTPPDLSRFFGDNAKAAQDAARKARDAFNRMIEDAARAREAMRNEQIRELDAFGELIVRGLRRQAEQELRAREAAITAAIEREREAADERIQILRDEAAEAVRQIEARRDARIAALEAELGAVDDARQAEELEELRRELALAYDPRDRAEVEARIREFERRRREDAIREEIAAVRDQARTEIDTVRRRTDEAIAEAERERDATIDALNDQLEIARRTYDAMTDEWRLQSEARRLAMAGELDEISALLGAFVPEWATAGRSWGEALVAGLRSSIGGFVGTSLGQVPGTPQFEQQQAEQSAAIERQQQTGKAAVAAGAPAFAVDAMRRALVDLGVVPQFAHGGVMDEDGLAYLHRGELVLNQSQQAQFVGGDRAIVFQRGAFDFRGANLTGTIAQNRAMMQDVIDEAFDDKFGREAALWGVR